MSRVRAVLQLVLALTLFIIAIAVAVNMALIAMRTQETGSISVVNTIIGQTVLIVCLAALGRILMRRGLARYREESAADSAGAEREDS